MAKKTPDGYEDFNARQYGIRTWRTLDFIQRVWDGDMAYITRGVGVGLSLGGLVYLALFVIPPSL